MGTWSTSYHGYFEQVPVPLKGVYTRDDGTLAVCLQLLQEETSPSQQVAALHTLLKILRNIAQNPTEEKYRRLRKENQTFKDKVWQYAGAQQFLLATGWLDIDDTIILTEDTNLEMAIRSIEDILGSQQTASSRNDLPVSTTTVQPRDDSKPKVLQEERKRQLEAQRRQQEERKRISEQIKADREENRTKETKASKARELKRGANVKRFGDIGVDLNSGGG